MRAHNKRLDSRPELKLVWFYIVLVAPAGQPYRSANNIKGDGNK